MTSLPSYFKVYRQLQPLTGEKIDCQIHILPGSRGNIIHSEIGLFDAKGHLLGLMEGVDSTSTEALNRLSENQGRNKITREMLNVSI